MDEQMIASRFWSRAQRSDGCWQWTGTVTKGGYGSMSVAGKGQRAHRISWWLTTGEWPKPGLCVCHRCDNRLCVRPEHLFLGTVGDNNEDMRRKGRLVMPRPATKLEHARGEQHGRTSLTREEVLAILYSTATQRALAKQFGVSQTTVCNILHGRTWSHLRGETVCNTI